MAHTSRAREVSTCCRPRAAQVRCDAGVRGSTDVRMRHREDLLLEPSFLVAGHFPALSCTDRVMRSRRRTRTGRRAVGVCRHRSGGTRANEGEESKEGRQVQYRVWCRRHRRRRRLHGRYRWPLERRGPIRKDLPALHFSRDRDGSHPERPLWKSTSAGKKSCLQQRSFRPRVADPRRHQPIWQVLKEHPGSVARRVSAVPAR